MTQKSYKISLYLGKEVYEQLQILANFMGLPISTTAKLLLNTGFEFAKAVDTQSMLKKGGNGENGEQQPEK